ncbi:alpha/beta hydrolase [Actinomadura nitritigenes]|uniref:alpha/beta hydrolase n=1 Tax=Actinomadura nitritigenes TaxID=134602 RepID=UPI003D935D9F
MVSFSDLRNAKPGELDTAWRSWRVLVERLEEAEDAYRTRLLGGVRNSRWQGRDAEAAMRTLVPVQERIRVSATEASAVASVLDTAGRRFRIAQLKLDSAISEAEAAYLKVGDDGSLAFPDALPPRFATWDEYKLTAYRVHGKMKIALDEATKADTEIAAALHGLDAGILDRRDPLAELRKDAGTATRLAGFKPGDIPPKGKKTPAEIAQWWRSLPEEQRHLLMNAYPSKIGWLNGIPSEDRDEANRTDLQSRIADIEAKGGPRTDDERRLVNLQRALDLYDKGGTDKNHTVAPRDVYLLGLRNDGDGQAIVAFGNPDTSPHTSVYVPGTGDDLNKVSGILRRNERLWAQSQEYAHGQVASIMWLGYDPPDTIPKAALPLYAENGAPAFDGFVDGLRQAQGDAGTHSHVTVVGHSYGTRLTGEAASHGDGLKVDDMVAVGSPGMGVTSVRHLHIDQRHFWSESAPGDLVSYGAPVLGSHGAVPGDGRFGGNMMTTDTEGHSGYWDLGSVSLQNQARVVVGDYGRVGFESGRPPS